MRALVLLAAAALSACAALPVTLPQSPPAPAAVADKTVLDEQALLALELAYKGGRMATEAGIDLGLIRGELALKVAAIDGKAFAALGAARSAYRAGNAQSYGAALTEGQNAVAALLLLAGK